MQCLQCRADNDAGLRFCESCGATLARLCPNCGQELKPQANFCGECGADIRGLGVKGLAVGGKTEPVTPSPVTPNPLSVATAPPRPRHRLAAVDWLLLGTLLPVCVFGFVMSVVHGVRGDFVVAPFWVSSAPDAQSYPIVVRILSSPGAEASPLAVGDRVLRLEGSDLRGVSNAGLVLRWSRAAQAGSPLAAVDDRTRRRALRRPRAPRPWV